MEIETKHYSIVAKNKQKSLSTNYSNNVNLYSHRNRNNADYSQNKINFNGKFGDFLKHIRNFAGMEESIPDHAIDAVEEFVKSTAETMLKTKIAEKTIETTKKALKGVGDFFKGLFGYETKLGPKSSANKENEATKIAQSIDKEIEEKAQKTGKSTEELAIEHAEKMARVAIPLENNGNEKGLNRVIGLRALKERLYRNVLMPLCEVADGKRKHLSIPNGICFFGPKGTGKTNIAQQLAEHYQIKGGGYFEKLKFVDDNEKDVEYLNNKFTEAEKRFIDSGKTKYTMLFLDESDKRVNKTDYRGRTAELLELSNDCRDRGVILVTTANYLDKMEPALLRNGRIDMRIPLGHIPEYDLADITNFYLHKNNIPHEENLDFQEIIDTVKTKDLKYKPKDIDLRLSALCSDLEDYGKKMDTDLIKKCLLDSAPEVNEKEISQFESDKLLAKQSGGIYEY